MIVVADASPLNYLVLIDQIGLLPVLYQQVLIPEAVLAELRRPRTPKSVGLWIASPCHLLPTSSFLRRVELSARRAPRCKMASPQWPRRCFTNALTGSIFIRRVRQRKVR